MIIITRWLALQPLKMFLEDHSTAPRIWVNYDLPIKFVHPLTFSLFSGTFCYHWLVLDAPNHHFRPWPAMLICLIHLRLGLSLWATWKPVDSSEILHHLGCKQKTVKKWAKLPTSTGDHWCRMSYINNINCSTSVNKPHTWHMISTTAPQRKRAASNKGHRPIASRRLRSQPALNVSIVSIGEMDQFGKPGLRTIRLRRPNIMGIFNHHDFFINPQKQKT